MSELDPNLEKLVRGICWKLYLEEDSPELEKEWDRFKISSSYRQQASKISKSFADLAKQVFDYRLEINDVATKEEIKKIEELWVIFLKWILNKPDGVKPEVLEKLHNLVNHDLKESFRSAIDQVISRKQPDLPPFTQAHKETEEYIPAYRQMTVSIGETSASKNVENRDFDIETVNTSTTPEKVTEEERSHNTQSTQPAIRATGNLPTGEAQERMPTPVKPPWKYLPVPEDEPDKHEEFDCKAGASPEGLKLIGARVRGKAHKHKGTNCDDWFEFAVSGNWTIIAVSDGAGSKTFSRLGAKVSCQAAVKQLSHDLKFHNLFQRQRAEQLSNSLKRHPNWDFFAKDINDVQTALHQAMNTAYEAVEAKAEELHPLADYSIALGGKRKLDIKDLSATLLLAVHTTVKAGETNYNLVLTCQVGDGMLAAVSQESKLQLLGKPDTGEHGGQTEFITSKKVLDKNNLLQKTYIFPGKLRALMVMSDGVSEDYFPHNPGMLELYGDLVLNQIVNISQPDETEISQQLRNTHLGSRGGVEEAKHIFQDEVERILPDESNEPKTVFIRSVAQYARELGKDVKEVVASSALLAAGRNQMCSQCHQMNPEEKLQLWLDSYYRRGSFDDRTLVVLYREEV